VRVPRPVRRAPGEGQIRSAPTGTPQSVSLGSALFGASHLTNVLFRGSVALVLALPALGALLIRRGRLPE
jgi:hypothetical protein